ncbi:MAG: metallophosphoesterase [Kiritimatiellae bacterium]|nr:metallophosphoesterase [Kiritimatiellia bacterium]
MSLTRRGFIGAGTAFAALAGRGLIAAQGAGLAAGKRRLRIGIVSDIHVTSEEVAQRFRRALEHFRSIGVDGVCIPGDLADGGVKPQLAIVADTWFKVFPNNLGADGKPVEKLFIYGNHDIGGHKYSYPEGKTKSKEWMDANATALGDHRKTFWEELFKEPWEPIWKKTVKGYVFVGGSWSRGPFHVDGAPQWLRAHADELKGERPFFYMQHPHPKGTIPYVWSGDDGTITAALKEFPNVVAITGHSHATIVDERSLWQGEFTCVNAGSLRYTAVNGGRENSRTFGVEDPKTSQMPFIWAPDSAPAMTMDVYDDALVFSRYDIISKLPLGADWVVPWSNGTGHGCSYEERYRKLPVPQFAVGAAVKVSERRGKNRRKEDVDQVVVEFPNVRKMDGSLARAYDFEVTCEVRDFDVERPHLVKRVFSPKFYMPEQADAKTVACVFAKDELPKPFTVNDGPQRATIAWRFVVRPCSCFGRKGVPISTDWFFA